MSMRFSDDWDGFTKATAEANRLNKITVFDALSNARITYVVVGFDGQGDQGQVGKAVARTEAGPSEFPAVILGVWIAEFGCTELGVYELSLQEAVEHLCCGYVENRHGGWELSEGSFGEFIFDVATRTVTLDFYGRLIDIDYLDHTF